MSLIQLGQKFCVRDSYKGSYLLPGETFVTLSQTDTGRVEFAGLRGQLPRQLPVSLLEHLLIKGEIALIEEPAKPMPQTAAQVKMAMHINTLQIRTAQGKALDAIGAIFGVTRGECLEDPFKDESDEEFQHRIHKVATATPEERKQQDSEQTITAVPVWPDKDYSPVEQRILKLFGPSADPYQPQLKMEKPMSKVRIVDVFLFDDTPGLKAEDRLIAKYEGITTDGSDTDVIVDLALNHNIKEQLASHNEKRAKTVNEDLLNRVGKKVMLLPLEAKQIEYRIKPVVQL